MIQSIKNYFKSENNLKLIINHIWVVVFVFAMFYFTGSKWHYYTPDGRFVSSWHREFQLILVSILLLGFQIRTLLFTKKYKMHDIISRILIILFYMFNAGLDGISHYYEARYVMKELFQVIFTIKMFTYIFFVAAFWIATYVASVDKDREFIEPNKKLSDIVQATILLVFVILYFIYDILYIF